jgi:hypothetical protein
MHSALKNLLLLSLLTTAVTFGAAAGGNQEQQNDENQSETGDRGTRIEIEEPTNDGEDREPDNQAENSEQTDPQSQQQPQDGPRLLRDEDGDIMAELDRPAWAVAFHENRELFQQEVSDTIGRGYVPTGMEATTEGRFTILYSLAASGVPDRWLLESYTASTINEELSQRLVSGLTPLAFSVLDETYYVLFAAGGAEVSAWRIHETGLDTQHMQSTISSYQQDGYSIVDISIDPSTDKMWYLFVQQENRTGGPESSLFINAYPNGEQMVAGISSDYLDGRGVPFGLASGDDISTVLFDNTRVLTTPAE